MATAEMVAATSLKDPSEKKTGNKRTKRRFPLETG